MATKKTTKSTRVAKSTRTARSTKTQQQEMPVIPSRPQRPLIPVGTWIVLIVFAFIVFAAIYIKRDNEQKAAEATPTAESAYVIPPNGTVTGIEVQPKGGDAVKIERNDKNVWALTLPSKTEADQGLSEAAASQVTALKVDTELEKGKDPSIFGLSDPAYVITITFEGGKTSTLEIGDITPSQNGYYVRLDKGSMFVVGKSGIDALTNLVTAPPYLNTPTATATETPLPTETPVPPTAVPSTPEVSPTP